MSTSSSKGFTSSFSKWILISLNLNSSISIMAANGDSMSLAGIGSVDTPFVSLSHVYYILSLTMSPASVRKICDSICDVKFSIFDCLIYDRKTQNVVGTGHRQGYLYVLDHFRDIHDTASSNVDFSSFLLNRSSSAFYLWHYSLGPSSLGCKLSKFSALPFSNSVYSSNAPFDLVHSDVWGPSPVSTKGCSSSFASFVASIHSLHEPKSYTEAVYDPLWQGAMAEELAALHQTHIYNARLVAKDLGLLRYFLGIEVASSPKGYLLSQSKYIGDLLDRARITDEMVEDIHIDAKAKYTPTNGDPLHDPSLYRTIVGSLVYHQIFLMLSTCTQFQTLLFPSTSYLDLHAYCDADWAGDSVTRKSTTGFCVFLRDSLISWKILRLEMQASSVCVDITL
ncbi:uncharacterized mitochondrial protein-like protein [Tanacetum coccineum]